MKIKWDLSTLQRLTGFIKDLEASIDGGELTRAALLAGDAYCADVQKLAPVDTGFYRSRIRADVVVNQPTHVEVACGAPVPYMKRLEYGFHGPDKRGRKINQNERPHWRPAWYQGRERYRGLIQNYLRKRMQAARKAK